jgi:iron complex outermembrane receptor protein
VLGVRYSYERKYDYYGSNSTLAQTGLPLTVDPTLHLLPVSNFLPNGTPLVYRANPYTNHNWSPRVGLNYKLADDVLLYAFWQRAYKSGGFNANAADLNAFQSPYGAEKVDNFEGGIKSEFLDHKLRVNLSAFYGRYKGLQRSQVTASPTAPSGVTTVTSNSADLKSYGIEAEIAVRPTRQLTMFINAAYDRAYYTRYCADLNGAEASPTPTLAPNLAVCGPTTTVTASSGAISYLVPQDYSANKPLRAPKFDITGGFTQQFSVGTHTLSAQLTGNYRSSVYTDLLNRPFSFRRSMFTLDGNLRWTPENGSYSISVWGRNLTNRVDVLGYTPVSTVFAFGAPTPPRQYGVTMSVNF